MFFTNMREIQGVFFMTWPVWNAIKWRFFVQYLQFAPGLFLRLCGFKITLFCPKYVARFTCMMRSLKWGLYVILVFLDLFVIIYRHSLLHCEKTTCDKNTYEPIYCRRNLGHSQKVRISQCRWKMRLSLLMIGEKNFL